MKNIAVKRFVQLAAVKRNLVPPTKSFVYIGSSIVSHYYRTSVSHKIYGIDVFTVATPFAISMGSTGTMASVGLCLAGSTLSTYSTTLGFAKCIESTKSRLCKI